MLDSIIDAVKGQAISAMTGQTQINQQQAEQALPLAQESITEGLMGAATSGKFGEIGSLLKLAGGGGTTLSSLSSNPIFSSILGGFAGKLVAKLGLGSGVANSVAGAALPLIMSKLGDAATKEGGDSLDLGTITKLLGGGAASSAGGALGGLAEQAKGMLGGFGK